MYISLIVMVMISMKMVHTYPLSKQPDWFNDIIDARKLRDKYHKLRKWNEYKLWRNKTIQLIETAKRNFFKTAVGENKTPSYLWRHLKDQTNRENNTSLPEKITHGKEVIDNEEIINYMNHHFINISSQIDKNEFDQKYFTKLKTQLIERLQAVHSSNFHILRLKKL